MSDFSAPLKQTLTVGKSGSGKTTFCINLLLNQPAACRFVFDDRGQVASRLKKRMASTAKELEAALASRWVVFNPHRMFPGRLDDAFRFFCKWVFDVSCRGRGTKLFFVDEFWRFCTPHYISPEFQTVIQMGRVEGIELVLATQTPQRANASVTGQTTELVCFLLQGHLALKAIDAIGIGADTAAVSRLKPFHFISYGDAGQTASGVCPF